MQPVPSGADQLEMSVTDRQLQDRVSELGYDRPYVIVSRDWSSGKCVWSVLFQGDDHPTIIK